MADLFALDVMAVRRAANAAAKTYDGAAALQAEVRQRLLERLDYVKLEPAVVVDLGAATGAASAILAKRYPDAHIVALDSAEQMLRRVCARTISPQRLTLLQADAAALPLADGSVDLIFCNLLLPWCNDPMLVLAECRRVLRPGGLFNFATLGPDTLYEMREAWAAVDQASHVHRFADMHNVGDAVVAAGMAETVLDLEYITLCYRSVNSIMRELKACGAHNSTAGRSRGLTGRARLQALNEAYEQFRDSDGRLPVSCEVIYGQAWGPFPKSTVDPKTNEAHVPVSGIGRRATGERD